MLWIGYTAAQMSVSATATAKISILCLYRRIFTTQSFRRSTAIVGLFVLAYWTTSTFGGILQCIPIQASYRKELAGKRINFTAFVLSLELVNFLLDVVIILLPCKELQSLQLPRRRKIELSIIFVLGGL